MPRDDRTREAFEMIEQGVKGVFSSDNFKNYQEVLMVDFEMIMIWKVKTSTQCMMLLTDPF